MDWNDAILRRTSRRSYLEQPLDETTVKILKDLVTTYNVEGELSLELVINDPNAFGSLTKTYGLFNNVTNYLVVKGEHIPYLYEKLGYYGQKFALEATKLGLGTCWVGGTFDRKKTPITLKDNEAIYGVITIGYVEEEKSRKEKAIYKLTHRKTKPLEKFYTANEEVPSWFVEGIKAVQLAPSAMNKQPVLFTYKDEQVTASVPGDEVFQYIDLGIAKLHFELGTQKGTWQFGENANFIYKK